MASTDSSAGTPVAGVRRLTEADLPHCLALSDSAQWNQNEADWRMMLALGLGWGIEWMHGPLGTDGPQAGAVLAASIVVIPYRHRVDQPGRNGAAGHAWISMVLVLPDARRRGYARQLLRHALDFLAAESLTPVLDATPAGYPVYLKEGFSAAAGLRRFRREAISPQRDAVAVRRTRRIAERDWPAVMAFDTPAFGADRGPLLRRLAERLPDAARLAEQDGRITGLIFGRDGREACQIGPLVADDTETARTLLDDVLATVTTPVVLDLADQHLVLLEELVARGFVLQRPFTRMVRGDAAPGDPSRVVLMAGPELG
jgi:GNAT superfamily N-acetyltransferase